MTNHTTAKLPRYDDKQGKEYETGGKIVPIYQEMKTEEIAAQKNKAIWKNEQKNIITVNANGKWCAQEKNTNNKNPVTQKKYAHDDIPNKYLQKINDQKRKLKIIRKDGIENYKAFKKSYMN